MICCSNIVRDEKHNFSEVIGDQSTKAIMTHCVAGLNYTWVTGFGFCVCYMHSFHFLWRFTMHLSNDETSILFQVPTNKGCSHIESSFYFQPSKKSEPTKNAANYFLIDWPCLGTISAWFHLSNWNYVWKLPSWHSLPKFSKRIQWSSIHHHAKTGGFGQSLSIQ